MKHSDGCRANRSDSLWKRLCGITGQKRKRAEAVGTDRGRHGIDYSGKPGPDRLPVRLAYEEECDFPPVGMESQVMLVYSTGDTLTECVKEYMNSDYREVYALTPVTYKLLTPETDCLFQMDDYRKFPDGWCVLQTILMTTFKTNEMNELTKKLQQVMVPKAALIAYEYSDGRLWTRDILSRTASDQRQRPDGGCRPRYV